MFEKIKKNIELLYTTVIDTNQKIDIILTIMIIHIALKIISRVSNKLSKR